MASYVVLPDQEEALNQDEPLNQEASLKQEAPINRSAVLPACLWYLFALVLIVLDQYTKAMATAALSYGEQLFVTPFFNWTLLHNTGAAFSFLSDAGGWQNSFFCTVAAGVSAYIVYWIYRTPRSALWQAFALSLVLGGALGNLYDRIALGYVVDFIQVHYQDYYWPAFNVADSAICVGAVVLIISTFFEQEQRKKSVKGDH